MRLRLTPKALNDLRGIADYIRERNPAASERVKASLQDAMDLLADYPDAGALQRLGVRRYAVPRLPYLIFYRRNDAEQVIDVLTIRHSAREPSSFTD